MPGLGNRGQLASITKVGIEGLRRLFANTRLNANADHAPLSTYKL
jgi:hypothetical protein